MYERSRNHIAVGAFARADAPLARTLSDEPPRTQIADRRSPTRAFVPLCAGSAGSGSSGRRS
jgi:hypothetical protein